MLTSGTNEYNGLDRSYKHLIDCAPRPKYHSKVFNIPSRTYTTTSDNYNDQTTSLQTSTNLEVQTQDQTKSFQTNTK
jgi:phosphatidylserine/phosphatidylglycerophosphate/cardiolipin synthase-like enzyme